MSNPLFHKSQQPAQQDKMNAQQAFTQLRNDPIGYLKQAGYNVPDEISSNPMAIIQHLVRSGQVPLGRLQAFTKN
jgi:hypothetical protein